MRTVSAVIAVLLTAALPAAAQSQTDTPQQQGPTFRTGVDVVAVDVAVVDSAGKPVEDLLAPDFGMHFGVGLVIGIGVGLVSSVLGVAGGELLIPTLILVFGADVKAAGSASIMISIGVVMVVRTYF